MSGYLGISKSSFSHFCHKLSASLHNMKRDSSIYHDLNEDEFTVGCFESFLFAVGLEDALNSLKIMSEANTDLRTMATQMDYDRLRSMKYSVVQAPCTDSLAKYDQRRLHCDQYKLMKLEADRKLAEETLMSTYISVSLNRNYRPLFQENSLLMGQRQQLTDIITEEETSKTLEKELRRKLRTQRNKNNAATYSADAIIDNLIRRVEDARIMKKTKLRYVEKWQNARTEQHQAVYELKDGEMEKNIYQYKHKMDYETRIHAESEMYVNTVTNDMMEQVEYWMSKYDNDMDEIDLKTQMKRCEYDKIRDRRIYLEKTIERHDKELKAWKKFKEDRENANELWRKKTQSAITVQAWWRGLLVRKELGPYRPKSKKGGKKNKGQKSEKSEE